MSVLIVGGDGQDGSILQSQFAKQNVDSFVISRAGLRHKELFLVGPKDLNAEYLAKLFRVHEITKIFFLAAFSLSSAKRTTVPYKQEIKNHLQVESLLNQIADAVDKASVPVKFFYFSSSLVFGEIRSTVNELSPFNPNSLYADHKIRCEVTLSERFASNNLVNQHIIYFFNHESRLRSSDFFTPKLCNSIVKRDFDWAKSQMKNSKNEVFIDMGYAPQFMQFLIQLSDIPTDQEKYIFSTSYTYTIRKFFQFVMDFETNQHPLIQPIKDTEFIISNAKLLSELGIRPNALIHGHDLMYKLIEDWQHNGAINA